MNLTRLLFESWFSRFARRRILKAWDQADINDINRKGTILPCPYCGHGASVFIHRWTIDHVDHIGQFDNDKSRLNIIYGKDFGRLLSRKLRSMYTQKSLKTLVGRSYVDYRRCNACGLIYQNFSHTSEAKKFYYRDLYRSRYQERDRRVGSEIYGRNDKDLNFRQTMIGKYFLESAQLRNPDRILDVGCAEGILCKYFEGRGLIPYGIDPSLPMINYARHVLNLENVLCGEYSSEVYPCEFFDGIVTHHVLEHVVDIKSFFRALSRHLRTGGYLLVQTPCVDNVKSPGDYDKILLGGHLYGFSEEFLTRLMNIHDFEVIESRNTPCDIGEIDAGDLCSPQRISAWGDKPCGISILSRKLSG